MTTEEIAVRAFLIGALMVTAIISIMVKVEK
jgi:hypothetical protein